MKKRWIIVAAVVLLLTLAWVGKVYAQEDTGYPVDTETATETATATEAPPETETPPETEIPTETETPTETPPPPVDPTEPPSPTDEPTLEPTPTPEQENPVCDGSRIHPILAGLASSFDVPYETLVSYFCMDHLGIGEIELALSTALQGGEGVDLNTVVSHRVDQGLGWGQIWENLGIQGNGNASVDDPLKKNQDRNQHQDQVTNQGEDDQLLIQANYSEQKGRPLNSPPGLGNEDKNTDKKTDKDNGQPGMPPGQEGKTEDGKPGNGPKP